MREWYFGSGCSGVEGLSIYHDRDIGPPWRFAAQRGILVQEAREVDARSARHLSQARNQRVSEWRGRGRTSLVREKNANNGNGRTSQYP